MRTDEATSLVSGPVSGPWETSVVPDILPPPTECGPIATMTSAMPVSPPTRVTRENGQANDNV